MCWRALLSYFCIFAWLFPLFQHAQLNLLHCLIGSVPISILSTLYLYTKSLVRLECPLVIIQSFLRVYVKKLIHMCWLSNRT